MTQLQVTKSACELSDNTQVGNSAGMVHGKYPAGSIVCRACKNIAPAKNNSSSGFHGRMILIYFICGFFFPPIWFAIPLTLVSYMFKPANKSCVFCKSNNVCSVESPDGQRLVASA